jgi:hypothetical protein
MFIEQINQPDTSIRGEDTSPVVFFETVYRAFQQAGQVAGGPVERFYNIGGYTIRLRFAGSALVSGITPALEHLAVAPSPTPDLTICICDSISTGINMPPPLWPADVYVARGDIQRYGDGDIKIAFYIGPKILSILDTKQNLAFYWIRDGYQLPYYESGSPLRIILHWWMREHGRQYVHAGAVGTATGGVLLAGKGGSGKSTTALACLDSPLVYASDDYCLLTNKPVPYVYSLYNSAKLEADDIHRLPHLIPFISNSDRLHEEKALLFLHKHCPDKVVTGFPIQAILLPRVAGRPETTLTPASPIASLKALAPNTIFQLPGAGQAAFQTLAQFVRQVPRYYLELGTNVSQIPDVILGLLSEG